MDSHGPDARILAAVTRRGRRLLSLAEVKDAGLSHRQADQRVRKGAWQRPHPGVYVIGAGRLTWIESEHAALLAAGETALASCRAAARLQGIGEYGKRLIELTVTHGTVVHVRNAIVHRTRRPLPSTVVDGMACTSVEQTLLDLAAVLKGRLLHQAFTTAWRRRLTTPAKVLVHIDHHGGRGVVGTKLLREIASLYENCGRGPGSEAEADLLWAIFDALVAAGIELPTMQAELDLGQGQVVNVDLLWRERRKAIEMMGLLAHGDYVRQDADYERASAIRAAGYDLKELAPRAVRERPSRTAQSIVRWLLG